MRKNVANRIIAKWHVSSQWGVSHALVSCTKSIRIKSFSFDSPAAKSCSHCGKTITKINFKTRIETGVTSESEGWRVLHQSLVSPGTTIHPSPPHTCAWHQSVVLHTHRPTLDWRCTIPFVLFFIIEGRCDPICYVAMTSSTDSKQHHNSKRVDRVRGHAGPVKCRFGAFHSGLRTQRCITEPCCC